MYEKKKFIWIYLLFSFLFIQVHGLTLIKDEIFSLIKFQGHLDLIEPNQFYKNSPYTRIKRQLNINQTDKHVEIFVAYDQSMKDFHFDIDIRSYILSLFNYVSYLYSDASIGNHIKIWIVNLVELDSNLSNRIVSTDDSESILRNFCQWKKSQKTDAAILLTRKRLCNKRGENLTDNNCDTLGLTELGTMCNSTSNCAIVHDNGFATAFTIAHEIAHLFGIRHDNEQVCLRLTDEQNLMATSLLFNYNHYQWSNCSRYYFTQAVEMNRFPCLNNVPDAKFVFNHPERRYEKPGYENDLDQQCQRAFGIHFQYCKDLTPGPKCSRLLCREISSSNCVTNHAHWADGTLCSESNSLSIQRCFHGQCRNVEEMKTIDGNWGDWSSWSPCTRTCGSAIQKSQRFCDNPTPEYGGHFCSGQFVRIRSCEHNPPCKDILDLFRQKQCSKYNNQSQELFLPKDIQFEPKYNVLSNERCKLICKVSNDSLERSFIFNDRVDDGTPCGYEDDSQNICIHGVCVPFGCDFKYESNAKKDMCGICNGQNRTCRLISGRKKLSKFGSIGMKKIVSVPIDTTHVRIRRIFRKKDRYYLAMKYLNGSYFLNGLTNLQLYNITFRRGSSTIFYSGFQSNRESISIKGRLESAIEIQVISMYRFRAPATEVYWEYYRPFNKDDRDVLNWTRKYQGNCSTRCGQGYRYVEYECRDTSSNQLVDEEICGKSVGEKPERIAPCLGDCQGIGWVYGEWSECYLDGYCLRKRAVECRNASDLGISNEFCFSEFILDTERCADVACEQAKWNYTAWSDCDCLHSRHRQRDVLCTRNGRQVNDNECFYEPKPEEIHSCVDECPIPTWEIYPWQPCTATCSTHRGIRQRFVLCRYEDLIVNDEYCDQSLKPREQEWCTTNVSCLSWFVGDWSPCSTTCDQGIQRRDVYCYDLTLPKLPRSDHDCLKVFGENSKPNEQQNCSLIECPFWKIYPWSNCSGHCGLARRHRHVECIHNGLVDDENHCLQIHREQPSTEEVCSRDIYCPQWNIGVWSTCSTTCGIGTQDRSIVCQNNDQLVSSEECSSFDRPAMTRRCHLQICPKRIPMWMISNWTQCDFQTCTQSRTVQCVNSLDQQDLTKTLCSEKDIEPAESRICPRADCLEWRVAHWHGCAVKCGLSVELGSDYDCFNRQMPLKKLNNSECESVEPPLMKPIPRRICRRHCLEWRTSILNEAIVDNSSTIKSLSSSSLLFLSTMIFIQFY